MSDWSSPPRSTLERLVTAVSVKGASWDKAGSGGAPELTAQDWMAALSGSGDRMGETVIAAAYLGTDASGLKRSLHAWGMNRLIERDDPLQISAAEHRRLCALVVDQHCGRVPLTRAETLKRLGIGNSRYDKLRRHLKTLQDRLIDGESTAIEHLRRRVRH